MVSAAPESQLKVYFKLFDLSSSRLPMLYNKSKHALQGQRHRGVFKKIKINVTDLGQNEICKTNTLQSVKQKKEDIFRSNGKTRTHSVDHLLVCQAHPFCPAQAVPFLSVGLLGLCHRNQMLHSQIQILLGW